MFDILFMVFFLLSCAVVGLAITSRADFEGRYFVAPVVGFGVIATLSTLAYRYGAPTSYITKAMSPFVALCFFLSLRRRASTVRVLSLAPLGIIILVGILSILPKWTGGEQFYAFQINPYDQLNYLKLSTSISEYTYSFIKSAPPETFETNGLYRFVAEWLDGRPGLNIVHAVFYPPFFSAATDAYYAYMASFQVLMALTVAFLVVQVAPRRKVLAALMGGAFALGPLFQHTIDLNAWGQTAGMPLAFAAIGLGYIAISSKKLSPWLLVSLGAALCGVLFIYPEIASVVLVAGIVMAIAQLVISREIKPMLVAAIPCIAAMLIASLYWEGTISFLLRQGGFATQLPRIDWAAYYDGQLFGRDVVYWDRINNGIPLNHYSLASAFIDPMMGALGLFYFLPTPSIPINFRAALKALALGYMLALILSSVVASRKSPSKPLLTGLLFCLAVPLYALFCGYFWTAGKALGMVSPIIFVIAMLPIIVGSKWPWKPAAVLLLVVHAAFGLARPIAAASPDGGLYPSPYPLFPTKTASDWRVSTRKQALLACNGVTVDIHDPLLDSYTQIALTGDAVRWVSNLALRPYYDALATPVLLIPGASDCLITDRDPEPGYKTVIDLRRAK